MRRIVQFLCSTLVFVAVLAASAALVALVAIAMPVPDARLVQRFLAFSMDTAFVPVFLLLALGVLFAQGMIRIALIPAQHVWETLRDNRTLGEIMAATAARANRRKSAASRSFASWFRKPAPEPVRTRELRV